MLVTAGSLAVVLSTGNKIGRFLACSITHWPKQHKPTLPSHQRDRKMDIEDVYLECEDLWTAGAFEDHNHNPSTEVIPTFTPSQVATGRLRDGPSSVSGSGKTSCF